MAMKRRLWSAIGGLALSGPLAGLLCAADRPATHIYSPNEVVPVSITQQKPAPEQAVPKGTESAAPAPAAEEAKEEEDEPGLLQSWINCSHPELGGWLECSRIKISGHIEQGYTWNPDSPRDRLNFGRLFDDRSNDYRLNQMILTAERALDPQPCCTDWGFKAQVMYGSDARFVHYLGILDNATDDTVQPDLVELYFSYHLPALTEGGVDFKVGHFVTLHGAEVIYAPADYMYSHTYMFNFGIPFKHTGALSTIHLSDSLDVHLGVVNGINMGWDDNNDALAFHGGFMWKPCGNDDVVLNGALHIGPETDGSLGQAANDRQRAIFDLVTIVKVNDCLTSVTDMNVGNDEFFDASWGGIAQYFVYKLNDQLSLVTRGEVFRDDDGFAVFKDGSNDGFIDAERGDVTPDGSETIPGLSFGPRGTTYGALSVGLNYKPCESVLIRPELRWDWASGGKPFDDSSDNDSFTAGFDVIWFF